MAWDKQGDGRELLASAMEVEMGRSPREGGGVPASWPSSSPPALLLPGGGGALFTLVHLALWAQLGVLVRFWIDEGITSTCYGHDVLADGPSCSSSAEDEVRSVLGILVANMVGSFFMGFLTENKAHLVWFEQPKMPVSFLPEDHLIQHHEDLLLGLRVGFCGSLTTFASWAFQMVSILTRGRVGAVAIVLLLEVSSSLLCFILGEHAAIRMHMWVVGVSHRDKRERVRLWHNIRKNAILSTINHRPRGPPPALPEDGGGESGTTPAIHVLEGGKGDEVWLVRRNPDPSVPAADVVSQKYEVQGPLVLTSENLSLRECGDFPPAPSSAARGGPREGTGSKKSLPKSEASKGQRRLIAFSNVVFTVAFLALTTLWACLLRYDGSYKRRKCWMSLLFAPFGCFARWKMSMNFNNNKSGVLKGQMAWFPLGTFSINLTGTLLNSIVSAFERHYCISETNLYWLAVGMGAFETGFNGSLSTVSTFVAEVHKYSFEYPRNFKGWIYVSATFGAALAFGFSVYSWSVYSAQAC
mmetsp:Transcript_40076/g.85595  ORF Transcript_40076/g.85595 Transcript_40076/m.85595 type:complete len:527 (-) Transcript_40076:86-1666(-)